MTKRTRTFMENSARGRKMFSQPRACLTSVRAQVDPKKPIKSRVQGHRAVISIMVAMIGGSLELAGLLA